MEIKSSKGKVIFFLAFSLGTTVLGAEVKQKNLIAPEVSAQIPAQEKKSTLGACTAASAEKRIHMSSPKFWNIAKNKTETIYFRDLEKCFILNQKIEIFETKNDGGLVYWRTNRGTGKIQKIEKITFAEYNKREAKQTTGKELAAFRNKLIQFTGKHGPELDSVQLNAVTVIADNLIDSLKTYGSPKIHPAGKSFKKKEFIEEIKKGNVYDIRPTAIQKKVPLKGTKSLVFGDYSKISARIMSPSQLKKSKVQFIGSTLPRKKTDPIYIISGCSGEFSAYNAITFLTSMGYTNVGWLPGGMAEYGKKHNTCITPDKSQEATIVNAAQIRSLMSDKSLYIADVRSESRFTMVKAKTVPYPEKRNQLSMPIYRENVTLSGLTSHKEIYKRKFKIPTSTKILIVGENEYDWRAYKAAIYFKSKGYDNLYWYRAGIDDWAQKNLFHPNEYKLNRIVKAGELY